MPRPMGTRYDLITRGEVDEHVTKFTGMVRTLAADEQAKRERLAHEAATAYQSALEALRMTNDSMAMMAQQQVASVARLSDRVQWFEDRTLRGRVRRLRHWLWVRWYRLTTRTVDHD